MGLVVAFIRLGADGLVSNVVIGPQDDGQGVVVGLLVVVDMVMGWRDWRSRGRAILRDSIKQLM